MTDSDCLFVCFILLYYFAHRLIHVNLTNANAQAPDLPVSVKTNKLQNLNQTSGTKLSQVSGALFQVSPSSEGIVGQWVSGSVGQLLEDTATLRLRETPRDSGTHWRSRLPMLDMFDLNRELGVFL